MKVIFRLAPLLAMLLLAACGASDPGGPRPADPREIAELASRIAALDPSIDPAEAARAAQVAHEETYRLALQYRITDPPLVHNTKVNMGLKPRGLCWHWAEDLETRLRQEDFRTLRLHRGIAPPDNIFRLEHSAVIVSSRGASMFDGLVLDPWRQGGILWWGATRTDANYRWQPRETVLAQRRQGMTALAR